MFTNDQKQRVLETVEYCAVGVITTEEMVRRLEAICKQTGESLCFVNEADVFGTEADPVTAILNSTSTMAERP